MLSWIGISVGASVGVTGGGDARDGIGVRSTLGAAGVGTAGSVESSIGVGSAVCLVKSSASCRSAVICSSAMGANGVAGCGLSRADVSCAAASRAVSAEVVCGIAYRYGKNSTVRAILSDRVLGM